MAAIRSGDYYMFEDLDEELDLITEHESESTLLDSDEDEAARGRGITVSKVRSLINSPRVTMHCLHCLVWLST